MPRIGSMPSLSARRAWIEMLPLIEPFTPRTVALRKESVDRNLPGAVIRPDVGVALRKESVDRNSTASIMQPQATGRSPQGERG